MSSLPSLGPRGEGWVAIQGVLLMAVALGGVVEGGLAADAWSAIGAVLVLAGGAVAVGACSRSARA
ncbi:MAG: hypothetical protein U0838_08485 [Chloroflexota bacterium]